MSWKNIKLGEVITHRKEFITIDDAVEYKRCRVQVNRKGVVLRDEVKGLAINTKKQQLCKAGDFLVAEIDAKVGGYGFVGEDLEGAIVSSHYFLFDVDETKMLKEYLGWLIKTDIIQEQINSKGSTNYAAIRPKNVLDLEIPLPTTISEQRKIVNRLNAVHDEYALLQSEIENQQSYLHLLRQTILQEAVQGKLTQQNPADEPASELLKRIKAEKQKAIKEGKLKKEKELPPTTDDEIPFALPEGWVWCRLGELILKSEAGKSLVCERREAIHPEWGIIKVSAMSWGKFDEKENKVLPTNVSPTLEYKINEGDYLISRANTEELIGKSVIVGDLNSNLLLSDKSIRLVFSEQVSKSYLKFYNDTNFAREYYKRVASGTSDSMKNITREQMYHLPIPLPSYPIQNHIVEKVESFFHHITQLEQQVTTSQTQARQLLQAVLAEAFEAKEKVYEVNEELSLAAEK